MTKAAFAVALVVGSGAAIMAQPRGIHRVAWLQGCWETASAQPSDAASSFPIGESGVQGKGSEKLKVKS